MMMVVMVRLCFFWFGWRWMMFGRDIGVDIVDDVKESILYRWIGVSYLDGSVGKGDGVSI